VARSESRVNRRDALRTMAASAVGVAALPVWVESLTAQARAEAHAHAADAALAAQSWTPAVLTARQNDAIVALTDLIIPATDTPGAKAALVNRFVDRVLASASATERDEFVNGLTWLDGRCRARFGHDLVAASPADLTELLTPFAKDGTHPADDSAGVAFFHALKSMTINGYYTTEIGLRQELGEDGRMVLPAFEGCTHPEHQ